MKPKLADSTVVAIFVIVALVAIIIQQSMALHQSWRNEHSLSDRITELKGKK